MKLFLRNAALVLTFGLMSGLLQSAVTETAKAYYFEPTQSDFDCCSQAIIQQQAAYVQAKKENDWKGIQANALFHWVKSWGHFNHAMSLWEGTKENWSDIELLKQMQALFDQADAELALAKPSAETKDCAAKVARNRDWVEKRIAELSTK